MKLSGSITITVYDKEEIELEVIDIDASEFGLEETGIRNYGGEHAYRGLYIYFNSEYGFDVLLEVEEMNHTITDFELSLRKHNSEIHIRLDMHNLEVSPTNGGLEYNNDDWY